MEIQGTEVVAAPRETVWRFVTDAEFVGACTPGVESVRVLEPNKRFEVVGGVNLGTVALKATTVFEWTRLVALEEAEMTMRGKGPGTTIDGTSELRLRDVDGGTALDWKGSVKVRGAVAAMAARLLQPVTERVLREFFAAVKSKIEESADTD